MMMVFQDSCAENRERLERGEVERRAKGKYGGGRGEREMELLGGLHGVREEKRGLG